MPDPHGPRGHVLVITDDAGHGEVLRGWVESARERPVVLVGAESLLMGSGDDETVDLVVTDLDTDAPDARRLIDRMSGDSLFPGVPKLHLLRRGADRDRIAVLDPDAAATALVRPLALDAFVARARLAAEVGRLRRAWRRSSTSDETTGLPNRRYVLARLEQEFSRSRRYRSPLSLAIVDIDGLRRINRRWDENVGDRVIHAIAAILVAQCRKEDLVGRVGEDSFAFVLPGTRYRGAAVLAHKLRAEAESMTLDVDGKPVEVRLSAGISALPDNDAVASAEDLLGRADAALLEAKRRGGNRVHIDEAVLQRDAKVVLLADRDADLVERAEEFLLMDDYRVVRALNPEAVLAALRFATPDLIVLDLQMPGPDASPSLLPAIRQRLGDERRPVVGTSSTAGGAVAPAEAEVDRLLTKPFSVSVLRHLARELLESDSDRPDLAR